MLGENQENLSYLTGQVQPQLADLEASGIRVYVVGTGTTKFVGFWDQQDLTQVGTLDDVADVQRPLREWFGVVPTAELATPTLTPTSSPTPTSTVTPSPTPSSPRLQLSLLPLSRWCRPPRPFPPRRRQRL